MRPPENQLNYFIISRPGALFLPAARHEIQKEKARALSGPIAFSLIHLPDFADAASRMPVSSTAAQTASIPHEPPVSRAVMPP